MTYEMLWFDVGIKRYTTNQALIIFATMLWFDVGIKRYTTGYTPLFPECCCGLMQESKDIQLNQRVDAPGQCLILSLWFDVEIKRFIMWIY